MLVVFHNLVTASIVQNPKTRRYLPPGRRRLYCLQEVQSALPAAYISDVGAPPVPTITAALPGLALQHPLLSCNA